MKSFKKLSALGLLASGLAVADPFSVSDERTREVLSTLGQGTEAKLCKTDEMGLIEESCFFMVDGDMYFTPEALKYWRDDPILPEGRVVRLVSDYYVENPQPVDQEITLFTSKRPGGTKLRESKPKDSHGGTGSGSSGIGHGANNGSGNTISISIGNNNGGSSDHGDRSCRSCHPSVHPGFGEAQKPSGGNE